MSQTEYAVARVGELHDGQMKEVKTDGADIVLIRRGGRYYALAAKCPHYGGPLAEGIACGRGAGGVYCPWHLSRFSLETGDLVDPPALDALPRFGVRVAGEQIMVAVPAPGPVPEDGAADRRAVPLAKPDPGADKRVFVILGGGAAGAMAAQTLRAESFRGRVVMVTQESRLPYDRPNLSKDYLAGAAQPEWMPLRPEAFYAEAGIEVIHRRVKVVNVPTRTLMFDDNAILRADALLLATGGRPRKLAAPGGTPEAELGNVFTLRSFDDADRIIAAATAAAARNSGDAARVVVVGSSFIGMEAAASLRARKLAVTVVAPGRVPFERSLGPEIGAMYQKLHEEHGVGFRMGRKVAKLYNKGVGSRFARNRPPDSVKGNRETTPDPVFVELDDGEALPADLVIAGISVDPATDMLAGVKLAPDGGVPVDSYLRVAEGVFAAGDIASFPDFRTGEPIRIEHWRLAQQHGQTAARNMLGRNEPFNRVPFFWTRQFDVGVGYVGHARQWDRIVYRGDPASRDFLAFYVRGGRVLAAAGCNRDRELAAVAELMGNDRMPGVADLEAGAADLIAAAQA